LSLGDTHGELGHHFGEGGIQKFLAYAWHHLLLPRKLLLL
jgi:hypothetical protein